MQGITGVCKGLKGYPKDYRGIRITGVLHGCARVIQGFKWDYRGMEGITGI